MRVKELHRTATEGVRVVSDVECMAQAAEVNEVIDRAERQMAAGIGRMKYATGLQLLGQALHDIGDLVGR